MRTALIRLKFMARLSRSITERKQRCCPHTDKRGGMCNKNNPKMRLDDEKRDFFLPYFVLQQPAEVFSPRRDSAKRNLQPSLKGEKRTLQVTTPFSIKLFARVQVMKGLINP